MGTYYFFAVTQYIIIAVSLVLFYHYLAHLKQQIVPFTYGMFIFGTLMAVLMVTMLFNILFWNNIQLFTSLTVMIGIVITFMASNNNNNLDP